MRRLAPSVCVALGVLAAASCEVQTDLVLAPENPGTGGSRLDASTPDVTSPDARVPETRLDAASSPDALPPGPDAAPPPDAAVPDAGGCDDDDDCSFFNPRCDPVSRTCVDCLTSDDCDGEDHLCDPVLLDCVECIFDVDCTERDEPLCRDSECTER